MKSSSQPWVVFTDLDGTLLDHSTYKWKEAHPALEAMRRERIPLVIVTSKTRAEVEVILRGLRLSEPFVVENGGAIYLPKNYFPFSIPRAAPAGRGCLRVAQGTPRARLMQTLARAARRSGVAVRAFSGMSLSEVARLTGLTLSRARRACQREFDEPFLILNKDGGKSALRLGREITRLGLQMTRGSRFFHILGGRDKGFAVRQLVKWFRRARGAGVRCAGLGDSPNDIPMLRAVDKPILVARPGGRYDAEVLRSVPGIRRAGGVGPTGWNRSVLRLLGHGIP